MDTLLLTIPDTGNPGWDLQLDAAGNIALVSGAYAQAQDAASAIKTYLGEVYYNTTLGIPYSTQVLGKLPPLQLLKTQFIQAALTVPGIVAAVCFISEYSGRIVKGQVQITNDAGQTAVATF